MTTKKLPTEGYRFVLPSAKEISAVCASKYYSWNDKKGHICDRPKYHEGLHSENGQE